MKQLLTMGLVLCSLTFFMSCEKILVENPLALETGYYEMDFTVQSTDLTGFHIFAEESFTPEFQILLDAAGLKEDGIEAVYLKEAEVVLISQGTYKNFNILKFVKLTIYHDNLGEMKIAELDPVPQGISEANLDPAGENLLPYLQADYFILTAQGFLLERLYEDMDLHARVKFEVKAAN